MNQSETVTVSEQQETALQTTEDLIMKIKKTLSITLLNVKICRAHNLVRYNELRQRLINQ